MDALKAFRQNSLNQNTRQQECNKPDIFFQCREALNTKLAQMPDAIEHYMQEINKLTGRD